MRAAIIVTTKGDKSTSQFFEQASEGKSAFRSLKGDFDSARYWELSRPQKRIRAKAEKKEVPNVPFSEKKATQTKKASKNADKS
jgi:hypothetical protein